MTSTRNPALFIKESLLQGNNTAYGMWKAYRQTYQIPTKRKMQFASFLKYIGMLKRLGLIETVDTLDSGIGKGNMPAPYKKATVLRIKVTDSDSWVNPFKALYPEHASFSDRFSSWW